MSDVRIYANRANTMSEKGDRVGGFVLHFSPERSAELASALQELSEGNGAALFISAFENESKFKEGETYLSVSIGLEQSDVEFKAAQPMSSNKSKGKFGNKGGGSNRGKLKKEISSAFKNTRPQ